MVPLTAIEDLNKLIDETKLQTTIAGMESNKAPWPRQLDSTLLQSLTADSDLHNF